MTSIHWINNGENVLALEAAAIAAQRLTDDFGRACETLMKTRGHVIVSGMGKSGHIAAKLAATFASTGTPAFFVHPSEAGHGDLGMITAADTLLMLSFSGESGELLAMLPALKTLAVPVIAMTGNPQSHLAQNADIHIPIHIEREACPLNLAPTASTTAMLAVGDALAISLMQARDFNDEDFARSHPFGRLGRRLTIKVADIMRPFAQLPLNLPTDSVQTALFQITDKRLGMTLIAQEKKLLGIYTDGDLRRTLGAFSNALHLPLEHVMTKNPKTITEHCLAAEALHLMQQQQITVLPVLTIEQQLCGAVHIHDLIAAGVA
ncbi:KpsF/GutQ family sugar-phosphate isomerase [Dichelobacter nodosus]|uniref:Arabinose 5-phosphate isomerase n=1 Tax=Dichelobacter nodosus (strain VCS1703A) TaxID=246195 RepID=A5EVJ8_DICNV|nr:KpsF/GutQ family sugar-phosphate isomerase [Dichelobacter nodosus]ABQ13965.1 arabinose 5-phosphate isomerase [Dichelobacter nodosus VCS1703A]AXM45416.1 KpsF/GutQ family sugar-phosphate isomerase [Dichelobacter nodosus]KNZ40023.1 D-arabinose 5-phosphate isomerase [Dichelobacter nodosus]TGA64970.1 KpsF/GutQ family sugar-phosphate isomerase [Dichelobacter nodosus]